MEKEKNGFDDVCRVCANKIKDKKRQRNLFIYLRGKLLSDLKTITGVELEQNDELPNFICQRCVSELDLAIKFRERCIFSQNYLQVMLKKSRKEVMFNPDDQELYEDLVDEEQLEYTYEDEQAIDDIDTADNYADEVPDNTSEELANDALAECEYLDGNSPEAHSNAEKRHLVLLQESRPIKRARNFFICEDCGEYFNSESEYKSHLKGHKEHKEAEQFFPCQQCTASFKTHNALKFHRQHTHNNGRLFTCSTCGEEFLEHTAKQRHEIAHVNDRPYPCLECDLVYTSVEDLRIHTKITHSSPKFRCEPCNLDLSSRKRLEAHTNTQDHKQNVQMQIQDEIYLLSGEDEDDFGEYFS